MAHPHHSGPQPAMKDCCVREAKKNVRRHRDVATCDTCGRLLLGYGVEKDFTDTLAALDASGTPYEHTRLGKVWVIAKDRRSATPLDEGDDEDADAADLD